MSRVTLRDRKRTWVTLLTVAGIAAMTGVAAAGSLGGVPKADKSMWGAQVAKNLRSRKAPKKQKHVKVYGFVRGDGDRLKGATVTFVGEGVEKSATTKKNGLYKMKRLPQGTYTVTASHDDYEDESQVVTFQRRMTRLDFDLDPLPEDDPVHYVDAYSANPVSPYASWETAACDIQSAINAASEGDTVLVSNGIYNTGSTVVEGMMLNRIAITSAIQVLSVNGPSFTEIHGAGWKNLKATGTPVRCAYVGDGALLAGFQLIDGGTLVFGDSSNEILDLSGAGAWCAPSGTISHCVIAGNGAQMYGGGVYGGTVVNSMLGDNAGCYGGGATRATVRNCLFYGNYAYAGNDAIYQGVVESCTVGSNIHNFEWPVEECVVENTVVCFGSVTDSTVIYSCGPGVPVGEGNIITNPMVMSFGSDDYRLHPASPCIDAGTNRPWMASATDLDGNPRIANGRVDMGAYEY